MPQTPARRIIQLTDPHIGETRDHTLAGIRTYDSFSQVLAAVAASQAAPELLMVTGDIAALGTHKAYQLFTEQITFFEIPYAWLPGNHDDFAVMQEGIQASPYWPVLELGDWRVVSINTAVSGQVGGHLVADELSFLDSTLRRDADNPTVVFMHHPPLPVGCDWLDKQRVANADALHSLLARHANVRAIFTGHVHQQQTLRWAGIPVYTTPSTCFQFAPNSPNFALSDDPPGYRWIDLHGDGQLQTGVEYLRDFPQKVDHRTGGY